MRATGFLGIAIGLWVGAAAAADLDVPAEKARIGSQVAADYPALQTLYEDIHSHPELGLAETRTAALLAGKMRDLGFTVTEKVGGTGVVAIYRNGAGPVLMIRTELDALPMAEKTGLPYASHVETEWQGKTVGVAHSCGHDAHMAIWIGTAEALLARKADWQGTVMFIGQPGEEGAGGAAKMLADGLFTRFPKPDFGLALHVGPFPVGEIRVKHGAVSSAVDGYRITFKGRGGHGSMPSATIDPIVMGAHFVTDVQTVISREKDAAAFGVVTVGAFQAGTAGNIIPDQAVLEVNLRAQSPEVRQTLRDGIERTAQAVAMMAKAPPPDIFYEHGDSAVVNADAVVDRIVPVFRQAFGDRLIEIPASEPPVPTSEDYSEFTVAGVPSLYFGLGAFTPDYIAAVAAKGERLPVNHSPFFAPAPQPTIETGVTAMTLAALDLLHPNGS